MNFFGSLFKTIKNDPNIVGRLILILAVLGVLITAMLLSGPKPDSQEFASLTPTPLPFDFIIPPVVTNNPPLSEYAQTSGLIVGVAAIFLIVIVGTVFELAQKDKVNETDL
jgi:hypothetical protein